MSLRKERYLTDMKIDLLEQELDPRKFFRISRGCIINRKAIVSADRDNSGHLLVNVTPSAPSDLAVSRSRVVSFLKWMEG